VAKVEATGPLDVRFTLRRKGSRRWSRTSHPARLCHLDGGAQEVRRKINENPVGTGPFKFVEWKKDDHITVENFDGYWGDKASCSAFIFQPVPEASVRILKIQRGEGDVAWPFDPKDAPSVKVKADTDVLEQPGLNVNMAEVFNLKKAQFQNKPLRQALNYAINKQELAEQALQRGGRRRGGVLPATSWARQHVEGLHVRPRESEGTAEGRQVRGRDDHPRLVHDPHGLQPQGAKLAEAIQQYFQAVGVKSEIKTTEWTEYRKIRRQAS